MGPRPTPPRVLDRLRTRSPIFRRVAMNSRGVQTLSPRANCLINAGVSKKYYTTPSKSESISSRSQRSGNITITTKTPTGCCTPTSKNSRNTTVRPTRTNVAVNLTPRKSSAPTKLIRSINGSLESLPDTVTVRRKISTPAKSICPFSAVSHRNTPNPKPTSIKTNKRASPICTNSPGVPPKKFSAPSKLGSDTPGIQKISKDHSNSGPPLSAAGGFTSTEASKPLKKTPGAIAEAPQQKYLAPVKEEKKTKIKSKKMTSAPVAPPEVHASFPSDYPQGPMTSQKGPVAAEEATEKNNLEKMVSDLIKNSESKKQEIAALKIEINRLKEVIREKQSSNSSDGGKDDVSKSSAECSRTSKEGSYSSAHLDAGDEDEISRLEAIVDSLSAENRFLREHLQHLGVTLDSSPLSDQQKEMILSRVSSAFSQSGGCAENLSSGVGERDWDNKSSSSLSEISVACLQGRIQQMEETHYSTHEELQATLQELEDLREQMSECRMEIQTLQEEKQVILESLTQQTEKLNEARGYNDTLKLMLIQQSENSHDMSQCERTQRLMELLKSVQEDKELMYIKQDEIEEQMRASKHAEEHFHREAQLIRDRMKLLESIVESAMNDKKIAENELQEVLESVKSKENELSRVSAALTSAKDKITELEAAVLSGEKSELADVLERVRGEKESAEKEVVSVQRKVNQLVCENDRLKDQVAVLKENLLVTRNNAKSNLDDVQWHRTQLDERRRELEMEITSLKASLTEAQMTCQHHLEDKRELKTTISDLQKKLTEASERVADAERALSDERAAFAKQIAEWDQFQKDLLTSVRVANDFKTEALKSLEKTEFENCLLKERMKQMDVELDRTRAASKFPSPTNSLASINNFNGSSTVVGSSSSERRMYKGVVSNGDAILSDRRANPRPLSRGDSRVKSLIESIECATKHAKAGSRSSSTSSLASSGSENNNMKSQLRRAETESMLRNLPSTLSSISPLKESSYSNGITSSPSPLRALNVNTYTDSLSGQYSTPTTNGKTNSSSTNLPDTVKMSQLSNEKMANKFGSGSLGVVSIDNNKPMSILSNKIEPIRRSNFNSMSMGDKKDPLATLAQSGGSKRNALLKWCQNKTLGYRGVDITNFSSSWNDGLAFCALLATYLPDKVDYTSLSLTEKRKNFEIAFAAAESVGISTILDVNELLTLERPSWQSIFNYVTSIYSHFET